MLINTECRGGDPVDVVFGISGILTQNIERWLYDDVLPNINTESSRVGIMSFSGSTVWTAISLGQHTEATLAQTITGNMVGTAGWTNPGPVINSSISQFDAVSANSQQILILMVEDDPKIAAQNPVTVCEYKQALESRGAIQKCKFVVNMIVYFCSLHWFSISMYTHMNI